MSHSVRFSIERAHSGGWVWRLSGDVRADGRTFTYRGALHQVSRHLRFVRRAEAALTPQQLRERRHDDPMTRGA